MSRQQSRIKKTKNTNSKNWIVFCSKYNCLEANIKHNIKKQAHNLDNCPIMENNEIMVAYKCADPYNTINIVDDEMHTYIPCNKRCDSSKNFMVAKSSFKCFTTKRIYKFDSLPHVFPKM